MIKVENVKVYNLAIAVYSARNAMNSWEKSDSDLDNDILGANDLALAKQLYEAGTEHRKYARQIFVSMDITAPLYLWKEIDTYKVGVTSNGCSTMHTIHKKKFTINDFSHEHLKSMALCKLEEIIDDLNTFIEEYRSVNDKALIEDEVYTKKELWWQIIQLLPSSYNQKRTITMTYENVFNIIKQRKRHKLNEWNEFVDILEDLPYVKEIIEE